MEIPKEPMSIRIGREALQLSDGNLKSALSPQNGLRGEIILACLDQYLRLLPEHDLATSYIARLGFLIDELDTPVA